MPERPIECSGCQKSVKICYKEIEGGAIVTTHMCAGCPVLQNKFHGQELGQNERDTPSDHSLHCNACHTNMEAIRTGSPLGCSECYSVFEELMTDELLKQDGIAPRIKISVETNRSSPIHLGRSPGENPTEITLSKRLQELNEELNKALRGEKYEEAAFLRDQIKDLMDQNHE